VDRSSSLRKVDGALESVGLADLEGVRPWVVVDGVGMGVGGAQRSASGREEPAAPGIDRRGKCVLPGLARACAI
jgi:hypothetical protein